MYFVVRHRKKCQFCWVFFQDKQLTFHNGFYHKSQGPTDCLPFFVKSDYEERFKTMTEEDGIEAFKIKPILEKKGEWT